MFVTKIPFKLCRGTTPHRTTISFYLKIVFILYIRPIYSMFCHFCQCMAVMSQILTPPPLCCEQTPDCEYYSSLCDFTAAISRSVSFMHQLSVCSCALLSLFPFPFFFITSVIAPFDNKDPLPCDGKVSLHALTRSNSTL